MDDAALRAWAEQRHCEQELARVEAEIAGIMAKRRHDDERAETHARLCERHGLKPEFTSPRMLARAERLHRQSWESFVCSRYTGSNGVNILAKATPAHSDLCDKLRAQFDATWPPRDFATMLNATDGTETAYAHSHGGVSDERTSFATARDAA